MSIASLLWSLTTLATATAPGPRAIVRSTRMLRRPMNLPDIRLPVMCVFMCLGTPWASPMLHSAPTWSVEPNGVVVASAFASLRAYTSRSRYRVFAGVMPDWWNNVEAVGGLHAPILVVHSDTDAVNP